MQKPPWVRDVPYIHWNKHKPCIEKSHEEFEMSNRLGEEEISTTKL